MKTELKEPGTRQLVWLPSNLFEITEIVRKKFGMSRSGFYRYAITHLLQQMSILATSAKEEMLKDEALDHECRDCS